MQCLGGGQQPPEIPATHSSVFLPGESRGQTTESQTVGHDSATTTARRHGQGTSPAEESCIDPRRSGGGSGAGGQ